ncbi:lysis protein [Erwinia sp. ErVv1]|uniref:lysis protein n=1 Tax=Erwinia sp. ErVv1 TaxID=1603299 RepID=UPI0035114E2A
MNWLSVKLGIMMAGLLVVFILAKTAIFYRSEYHHALKRVDEKQTLIKDMQQREKKVSQIDKEYSNKLQQALENVSQLEHSLSAGRRLQFAATCNRSNSTPGVDDATRARPDNTAERDYFTLRRRIEIARAQISGLQAYIRSQCLNEH